MGIRPAGTVACLSVVDEIRAVLDDGKMFGGMVMMIYEMWASAEGS